MKKINKTQSVYAIITIVAILFTGCSTMTINSYPPEANISVYSGVRMDGRIINERLIHQGVTPYILKTSFMDNNVIRYEISKEGFNTYDSRVLNYAFGSVQNSQGESIIALQPLLAPGTVNIMQNEIPENATIAILEIASINNTPTADIRNDLSFNFHNTRKYAIVDRVNLDTIIREQRLQWSGEIDTRTATELGRFVGAGVILTGNMIAITNSWNAQQPVSNSAGQISYVNERVFVNSRHLMVQALDVETGRIISMSKIHNSDRYDNIFAYELVAIVKAVASLSREIPANTTIAVSSITPLTSTNLDYINMASNFTDEVTFRLFQTSRFVIMNRGDLDRIRREQNLGVSGQVQTQTAAELRRLHGVAVIVTGEITTSGDNQYLTLTALDTETARVVSVVREQIR